MTIKEIAKLAGVSSAAVSRYLNGGYVSDPEDCIQHYPDHCAEDRTDEGTLPSDLRGGRG